MDFTEVQILLYSLILETLRPWNFGPLLHGFLEAPHPFSKRYAGFVNRQACLRRVPRSARHGTRNCCRSINTVFICEPKSQVEATQRGSMVPEEVVFRSYSYQGRKLLTVATIQSLMLPEAGALVWSYRTLQVLNPNFVGSLAFQYELPLVIPTAKPSRWCSASS